MDDVSNIPKHMAHMQVQGNLPVPQVVSTTKVRIRLIPCEWPDVADLQTSSEPLNSTLDFGKYDEDKLRRCIKDKTCHVCGGAGHGSLLVCAPGVSSLDEMQSISVGMRDVPMTIKPWVCAGCLAFAVGHCPPLKERIAAKRGIVIFPKQTAIVSTYWKPADPGDPVPPVGMSVLSYFKIAFLSASTMPLWQWAQRFQSKAVGA